MTELDAALRLAIASLVGVGVGLEREWSGHSSGDQARFAGLRTFLMLGLLGGVGGLLLASGFVLAGAAAVAGGLALSVAAYVMTVKRPNSDNEGTTEVAALVVVGLGALAGTGMLTLAAGAGALVVLLLSEKQLLHRAVSNVRELELRAALRFAVLALVVLPLLPEGPMFGALELRPRALWVIVLIFSALNFAGFIARRAAGEGHGYGLVGLLGGLISSTAVTLDFSRKSREEARLAQSLASGVIGACTVLVPRVLLVSAVLNAAVAVALLPYLVPAAALGALLVLRDWRAVPVDDGNTDVAAPAGNPLRLWMAIRMAVLFQLAMTAIHWVRSVYATTGIYATSAVLGLTDVDALTVGMSRPIDPMAPGLAARAIAVGILTNTIFKLAMASTIGGPGFRGAAARGLVPMALSIAAMLWIF